MNAKEYSMTRTSEILEATIAREVPSGQVDSLDNIPIEIKATLVQLLRMDMMRIFGPQHEHPTVQKLYREFDKLTLILCPELYKKNANGTDPMEIIAKTMNADVLDIMREHGNR